MKVERPQAPLRFLIVEDESILALDIGLMIEDAGHVVVAEAGSLRELQNVTESITPDIAFVDMQLDDGSSGLDVCAHIKAHWADAIIVFLTANPKKVPADYAGGHGVIAKPFSRNGLMSAMRFLAEGVCDPPPSSRRPVEFDAAPKLASWIN